METTYDLFNDNLPACDYLPEWPIVWAPLELESCLADIVSTL